jgi:ribosomal protein L29
MSDLSDLYKTDFHAWTLRTAALVREHRLDEIDLDDLAEELDSMGAKERRELMSRLDVLLAHLLKWEFQPEQRTGSWNGTIREQRRQIARVLKLSPSLKPFLPEALAEVYPDAVERALYETGIPEHLFPHECPYPLDQVLDKNFYPGAA